MGGLFARFIQDGSHDIRVQHVESHLPLRHSAGALF